MGQAGPRQGGGRAALVRSTVVVHPPFRGSASTPAGSSRGWRGCRTRPTSSSRWRTCSRGGPAAVRSRPTSRTGTCSSSDYPAVTLDLSHTAVSGTDARRRRSTRSATGSRTCTSPTARLEQGRAPRARPGRPALRGGARAAGARRLRRHGGAGDQHPPRAQPRRAGGRPRRGARVRPPQPRVTAPYAMRAGDAGREPHDVRPRRDGVRRRATRLPRAALTTCWSRRSGSRCCGRTCSTSVPAPASRPGRSPAGAPRCRGRPWAGRARGAAVTVHLAGPPGGRRRERPAAARRQRSTWSPTPSRGTGPTRSTRSTRLSGSCTTGRARAVVEPARRRPSRGWPSRRTGCSRACDRPQHADEAWVPELLRTPPVVAPRRDGRDPVVAAAVAGRVWP